MQDAVGVLGGEVLRVHLTPSDSCLVNDPWGCSATVPSRPACSYLMAGQLRDHCCVVALAINADATKAPVGLWEARRRTRPWPGHCRVTWSSVVSPSRTGCWSSSGRRHWRLRSRGCQAARRQSHLAQSTRDGMSRGACHPRASSPVMLRFSLVVGAGARCGRQAGANCHAGGDGGHRDGDQGPEDQRGRLARF